MDVPATRTIHVAFLAALGAVALLIATELSSTGSRHVELATLEMTRGAYASRFWLGGVGLGIVVPAALLTAALAVDDPSPAVAAVAAVAALVGSFAYEDAYVRAGQSVPLS
ncbi:MAG: NrfD/PsrC family molybdoenzyme membrane anchor subunit [Ilumatobacteraceae bacterium]